MVTSPPGTAPVPCRVNGRVSPSSRTPKARNAFSTVPMGRSRARGSPSNRISPSASAAAGGTNRITVPARPQSIAAGPRKPLCRPKVTVPSAEDSTGTPRARNAASISAESRLPGTPCTAASPRQSAASTSARFVIDLDPGTPTVARTGDVATGADQYCVMVVDDAVEDSPVYAGRVTIGMGGGHTLCGRYAATKDPATLAAEFDAVDLDAATDVRTADYNVAPTKDEITVVQRHPRDDDGKPDPSSTVRSLRVMRWGFVPHWAKDKSIGNRMINARSDS